MNQGGAKAKRAVQNVAVPGNPANISRTPVNILIFHIKDKLGGVHGIGQVAASCVHYPFGFAC